MLLPHFSEQVPSALPTISLQTLGLGCVVPTNTMLFAVAVFPSHSGILGEKGARILHRLCRRRPHSNTEPFESTHQRHLRTVHDVYWR